jgi:hypothetical protein
MKRRLSESGITRRALLRALGAVGTFAFKATEPGALRGSFLDTHGGKYEGNADVRFS